MVCRTSAATQHKRSYLIAIEWSHTTILDRSGFCSALVAVNASGKSVIILVGVEKERSIEQAGEAGHQASKPKKTASP